MDEGAEFRMLMEDLISRATQPVLHGVNDTSFVVNSMLQAVDKYIERWKLPPIQTCDRVLLAFRDLAVGTTIADEFFAEMERRIILREWRP